MTEVRKGVKEVWLVEKCRKCIEREGEMRKHGTMQGSEVHLHQVSG